MKQKSAYVFITKYVAPVHAQNGVTTVINMMLAKLALFIYKDTT